MSKRRWTIKSGGQERVVTMPDPENTMKQLLLEVSATWFVRVELPLFLRVIDRRSRVALLAFWAVAGIGMLLDGKSKSIRMAKTMLLSTIMENGGANK